MAVSMGDNNGLNFGVEDEGEQPIWYAIQDEDGKNELSNLSFRDKMLLTKKHFPNVSACKYLNNQKTILFKSPKKNREIICETKLIGKTKCKIYEKTQFNTCKGTIFHHSLRETTDEELTEDLKRDNPNVVEAHIFTKIVNGQKIKSPSAVVTFDNINIPQQVIYLNYNILKTKKYYPNPTRCSNCFQYEHYHTTLKPCQFQKICGSCSLPYHLSGNEICQNQINCINCNGPHQAWSRNCKAFLDQTLYVKKMIDNRVSFKEAKNMIEKPTKTYGSITAAQNNPPTSHSETESEEIKSLQNQVAAMTTKLDIVCNLLSQLIKNQRDNLNPQPTEPEMEVESDTDSADEDSQIDATPNQPTVSDAKNYYTVDYSKRGNNNPPPQHNRSQRKQAEKRQAQEKQKEKETKKKKDKHSDYS